MTRLKKRHRRAVFDSEEDVNPMNFVSNLADAMLVLAVGMMLALVIAWNVDIINTTPGEQTSNMEQVQEFDENIEYMETENQQTDESVSMEDYGLVEYGTVYKDENGNYYVLEGTE